MLQMVIRTFSKYYDNCIIFFAIMIMCMVIVRIFIFLAAVIN